MSNNINDSGLLVTLEPTSDGDHQPCPRAWLGLLMTEDSSFYWRTKPRHLSSETSRQAGLEFVCVFGQDGVTSWAAALVPSIRIGSVVRIVIRNMVIILLLAPNRHSFGARTRGVPSIYSSARPELD